MESLVARSLLQANNGTLTYYCPSMDTAANDAGYQYWYQDISNSNMDQAVCCTEAHAAWLTSPGTNLEGDVAQGFQWLALAMCLVALGFYAYHSWKATTGWEEVYVAVVELIKVCLELTHQFESPATLYLSTGNFVMWVRYAEWLLTCPVILIHLSNITGLQDSYSKRTMMLLVSDLGTITMGVTAAACYAWPKWIFFFMGLCYGCNTYFHAAKVYVESYHIVPKGVCRNLVRGMAWCFYVSWTMFPLLFVFGPEGFGIMSRYGSEIAHTIADIISKQTWGLLGHFLRVKIHEHIIIHGNITKPTKLKVAGMEIEAEEMVDHDDPEGVNQGTKQLANRESFIIMRNRMKQQGVDVRGSFDESDAGAGKAAMEAAGMGGKAAPAMADNPMAAMMGTLAAGRVILAVPDISMVDFFRQQFAALPAPIELVPALGVENTIALVQQAMQMGGLDCVLAHPEFLRDRSATGLVNRLHSGGQRIVAFGWSPMGPMRELIESSGADAWLEGPSFGTSINQQQLIATLVRAQQARRQQQQQQMMMMMGGMGMGMGGMGMTAGAPPAAMMGNMNNSMIGMTNSASPLINGGNGMMSSNNAGNMMMSGMGMGMGGGVSAGGMGTPTGMQTPNGGMSSMGGMGGGAVQMSQMSGGMMGAPAPGTATLVGTNPLFNQPQASPGSVTPTRAAGAGAPGGGANEAEMLQQLMAEINRLKGELGEH